MKKIKIERILNKKGKSPIVCLTSYTKPIAEIVDKYCDIILVGDSLGTVLHGMKTTKEVSIDTMILHAKSVVRGSKNSLIVVDMPFKTYTNKYVAYKNAKRIINLTKCDAVKLEGGKSVVNIVKHLTKKKIPVMGHIGLLPQSTKNFKYRGKSLNERKKLLRDAILLSNSGVFAIVIECVVKDLAEKITRIVSVPTIGIGASKYCDGQVLVIDDIIGLSGFYPKFVKRYANVAKIIEMSVKKYCIDVRKRKFPGPKNTYNN